MDLGACLRAGAPGTAANGAWAGALGSPSVELVLQAGRAAVQGSCLLFAPSPPGSLSQPAYVLQIFPPCEFSESHLSRLAPDLLASISNISPHLMIVIASV